MEIRETDIPCLEFKILKMLFAKSGENTFFND